MSESPTIEAPSQDEPSAPSPTVEKPGPAVLGLLLLLAAAGMLISGYLTQQHAKLASGVGARSACAISQTIDCDLVNSSVYSEILSIPIALLGAIFYSLVAALVLATAVSPVFPRRDLLSYVTLGSLGAVLYSVFLAGVSKYVIGAWCLFCLSLYGLNLGLLGVSVWGAVGIGESLGRLRAHGAVLARNKLATAVLVIVAAGSVGAVLYHHQQRIDSAAALIEEDMEVFRTIRSVEMPLTGVEPAKGSADAPVTIVEFFDFQCGHCKKMGRHLETLLEQRAGEVRLVMKHLPLGRPCNRFMTEESGNLHPQTCRATAAALCAQEQDRYWEMHDALFFYQQEVTEERLDRIVDELALDRPAFDECVAAERTAERIDREVTDALVGLRLNATPALFVNGRFVGDGRPQPGAPLGFLHRTIDWILAGEPAEAGDGAVPPSEDG